MAQILKPDSEISADVEWHTIPTGNDMYVPIDEGVPGDDLDYAETDDDPVVVVFEVGLENGTDPGTDTEHVVKVRARRTGSKTSTLTVKLKQGAATIKTFTVITLTNSFTTTTFAALTEGEAAGITDYTDLRLEFTASAVLSGSLTRVRMASAQLELPTSTVEGVVSMSGAATIVPTGSLGHNASTSLTGTATVTPDGTMTFAASVAMACSALLTAIGQVSGAQSGIADIAGAATVAAVGEVLLGGEVAMAGAATLLGDGRVTHAASASLGGTATLNATPEGPLIISAQVGMVGTAALTAIGQDFDLAKAHLQGFATMTINSACIFRGSVVLEAKAVLNAVATMTHGGTVAMSGAATLGAVAVVAPLLEQHGAFSVTGIAQMSARGTVI